MGYLQFPTIKPYKTLTITEKGLLITPGAGTNRLLRWLSEFSAAPWHCTENHGQPVEKYIIFTEKSVFHVDKIWISGASACFLIFVHSRSKIFPNDWIQIRTTFGCVKT